MEGKVMTNSTIYGSITVDKSTVIICVAVWDSV